MSLLVAAPLLLALLCCLPILLTTVSDRADRIVTRVAIQTFGWYVMQFRSEHPGRERALNAAHVPTTYREYASKTICYAITAAGVAALLGSYGIWGVLRLFAIEPAQLLDVLPEQLGFLAGFGGRAPYSLIEVVLLFGFAWATVGALAGAATYWFRWYYPHYVADARSRQIEAAMPSTISLIYALSQSGMAFPEAMRIVAANEDTYGEAAAEFGVAVRAIDTFGVDMVTALEQMGQRSPSPQFQEFTENLVSVLRSGQSLSAFLERQYHTFQDEAEAQQEGILELLGTLAEAYVTVLVAGPLFLITILVVIGIIVGGAVTPLQAVIYLVLPLANLLFIVYLDIATESMIPGSSSPDEVEPPRPSIPAEQSAVGTDGGQPVGFGSDDPVTTNLERLEMRQWLDSLLGSITNPFGTLRDNPTLTFAITVPIAIGVIGWAMYGAMAQGELTIEAIDDYVIGSLLLVLSTFAVFYELNRRRIEAMERSVPDLLDRLASVNEAGTSMVLAIDHVRGSDLGALTPELDLVWSDVQWGADLSLSLRRLEARVRTRSVSRAVTLLTEAMKASGSLGTVLRIAGKQAAADRRLKRERAQVMMEYLVVVYVAFLAFMFIVGILALYLLPGLPGLDADSPVADVDGFGGMGDTDIEVYEMLFYHATVVQGLLSGLIAGQLSTGDVRSGAKHAAAMIALALLAFTFLI